MSEHTPGPWNETEYDNHGNGSYYEWLTIGPKGCIIAKVEGGKKLSEQDYANARLIAKAPELLEALEEAAEKLDWAMKSMKRSGWNFESDDPHFLSLPARAVIAEIKGS